MSTATNTFPALVRLLAPEDVQRRLAAIRATQAARANATTTRIYRKG